MSKAYLMLGKSGDVINIIAILRDEYERSGRPANLIVSKEYAPIIEGLEYANPVIYKGHWTDFKGGYAFAKQHFDRVEVPQMSGLDVQFNKICPSVMLDHWNRVGYLDQWDKLPLVLPHTGKTQLSGPTIFYADHSQSSPFFYKEELHKLIQETFPTHQVMRASGMRLKNLRDFLPIMDACDLIVSVETAFLHLSAACTTPVVAMVADQPSTWHGSPWSKRFAFHCRYNDFMARKVELVCAMTRAVNKIPITQPEIFSTARPHGYNLTTMDGNKFIYRYHPNGTWKTKLAIDDGKGWTQDIEFPKECDNYSLEDARYFSLNGQAHIAYTASQTISNRWYCVQAYGPIENIDGQWRVTKHIVPKYPGNDFTTMHKNWLFFEHGGKLYAIFGNLKASMEQLVLQIEGDRVVKEFRSPAPTWAWGGIRGGAIVPFKSHFLRFFHSRTGDTHKPLSFRYYIGASLMETEPPFNTVAVSSFPILAGNEKFVAGCHHWKPNCALPFGAVIDGDRIKVSIGLNDAEAGILDLSVSDLNL